MYFSTQIATNGIISFDQPVFSRIPTRFPGSRNEIRSLFLLAPFWDDVDIRRAGSISYEVHNAFSGNTDSLNLISRVDAYIQGETGTAYAGNWMLVVHWGRVHPWPHGEANPSSFLLFIFSDYVEVSVVV